MLLDSRSRASSRRLSHLDLQLLLLIITILIGWGLIAAVGIEGLGQTMGVFLVVAGTGITLITRLRLQLRDPHLQKLGYAFLAKLLLILVVLYVGWTPQLDPTGEIFGYDPQRYYFQAGELAESGFAPSESLINYVGILYYYGVLFALFGQNPVLPALINTCVTLLATLVLIRVGYRIKRERAPTDWTLGLAMIIPEVVWFDALTARESLTMALMTMATLWMGGYLIRKPGDRLSLVVVYLGSMVALGLLGLIRTSALVPAFGGMILLLTFLKITGARRLVGSFVVGAGGIILLLAPTLSMGLGSYDFDYFDVLVRITTRDNQFLEGMTWSERSLGELLIPENVFQSAAFAFPRLVFYLVAPLPQIGFSLRGLMDGNWFDWQALAMSMSSALYIALLGLALAGLVQAFLIGKWRDGLVMHLPCWVTLLAVAGGTQFIHERYRVMAVLLLCGGIWLGRNCPKGLIRRAYVGWLAILGLVGTFYVSYKFLL